MFPVALMTLYCISNIIATILYIRKNYMSTMFDGIAIATFVASILYFVSNQMRGVPVAQTLFSCRIHVLIVVMLILELLIMIWQKHKERTL